MDVLRLRYRPDDEWLGELVVSVASKGFAGVGSAWFSIDSLREFAEAVSAFPLPAHDPPSISGGLGGNEKIPPRDLVAITLEPHNALGAVRVTVHLATEVWNGKERDLAQDITTRFLVTYGDLSQFGQSILDTISGRVEEAVLTSSA